MKRAGSVELPSVSGVLKLLVTVLISAVFFYLFVRDLDLEEVWQTILDADYGYLPLGLALFAGSLIARTFRLRTFFSPGPPAKGLLASTLLVAYAANNLLPLRGGELLRAQMLFDRAGMSRMRTMGVALLERLFDLAVLGVFVIAGQFIVDVGIGFVATGLLVAGGAAFGLLVTRLMVRRRDLVARLASIRWLPLKETWRIQLRLWGDSVVDGFSAVETAPAFFQASAWTGLAWMLEFGLYWMVAKAFHIDEGFLTLAFVGAAASLSLSIPSAQGGVGPFQLVAKEALLKFGVATNVAGAYALALHVLLVVPVTAAGLVVFFYMIARSRDPRQSEVRINA